MNIKKLILCSFIFSITSQFCQAQIIKPETFIAIAAGVCAIKNLPAEEDFFVNQRLAAVDKLFEWSNGKIDLRFHSYCICQIGIGILTACLVKKAISK